MKPEYSVHSGIGYRSPSYSGIFILFADEWEIVLVITGCFAECDCGEWGGVMRARVKLPDISSRNKYN